MRNHVENIIINKLELKIQSSGHDVSETITIDGAEADDVAKGFDEMNKGVIFKYCAPFIDCLT